MATQQERNYFEQCLKVLSWLESYRNQADTHKALTFNFGGGTKSVFPGRGDGNNPNRYLYIDLAERGGQKSRHFVCLIFSVSDDLSKITKVQLQVGWRDEAGGVKNEYQNFAQHFGAEPNKNSKTIRIGAGEEQQVRQQLFAWLDANLNAIGQTLHGSMLSDQQFSQSLTNRIQALANAGIIDGEKVNGAYHLTANAFGDFHPGANEHVPNDPPFSPDDAVENDDVMPKNLICFGAPGTGKSYKLNMEACSHKDGAGADVDGLFENADHSETRFERVTFYPTYSYAQFVGTYKPVMKKPECKHEEEIAYEFVPGPFLRVLVKALNEVPGANGKKKDWCLIIEEINRANAAAVFGDVFQLLDRTSEGVSEYAVAASEDVKKYLAKELSDAGNTALSELAGTTDKLKMPANMYLWATMNSADQGVFPMDTAFKRRWEFEYIGIDESAAACDAWQVVGGGKSYKWNDVRSFINCLLSLNGVNEDKLMGPFFVKAENNFVPAKQFESKVLMYLWEDAARMCRTKLFASVLTYSKLVAEWRNKGPAMFSELMKEGTPTGKDGQAKELWKNLFPEPENNIE